MQSSVETSSTVASIAPETAAAVGLTLSGLMSLLTGGVFLSTGFPAIIGAALYATQKWKTEKSVVNTIIALVAALAIGWWGGPWIAHFLPEAAAVLPFIAFASAFWGIELLTELKTIVLDAVRKKVE